MRNNTTKILSLRKLTVGIFCLLISQISYQSMAKDKLPFEDEIKARQSFYQMVKFNISLLGEMAKGKRPYDSKLAQASADNILAASKMNNDAMWPKGSDNSVPALKGKTDALPKIWSNYPTVMEKHKAWKEASTKMAANAGKGISGVKSNIGALGKSCKSCHEDFRAE